jgi:hypothetical protein
VEWVESALEQSGEASCATMLQVWMWARALWGGKEQMEVRA